MLSHGTSGKSHWKPSTSLTGLGMQNKESLVTRKPKEWLPNWKREGLTEEVKTKNKFEKVTAAGPKTGALSTLAAKPPYVFKFNVNSIIRLWIFVAVIVTVLHYAIHQSIMAGVVEFVLGGLGYTWFLLMLAKPHLVEKIKVGAADSEPIECNSFDPCEPGYNIPDSY